VISWDNVITLAKDDLDPGTRSRLDRALRYSLDIIF
jgi:hypothetical protein